MSVWTEEDPGIPTKSSRTSDLNINTLAAILARRCRDNAKSWLVQYQYPLTGLESSFDLQILSQCDNAQMV